MAVLGQTVPNVAKTVWIRGIVDRMEMITLIGGAGATKAEVETAIALCPKAIAADGGADIALAAGVALHQVIGDLDSLSPAARATFRDVTVEVAEQETTDFEKCLLRTSAQQILAVGFAGGRLDHQLSVLNVMARFPDRRIVLLGGPDVSVIVPSGGVQLALPQGTRLSLMPLGAARVWSGGLRWDLTGEPMAPDGFLSISNETAGDVHIRAEGAVLLIVPAQFLPQVWQAVSNSER